MELEGKRVAVTGAGGFIGGAVAHAAAARGADVVGIDVAPSALDRLEQAGIEPAVADVTDPPSLDRALAGAVTIVHTAAFVHEWGSMAEFVRVNVAGTANVIDAAQRAGAAGVIHVSSVVVYGYVSADRQGEDAHRRTYGIPYIDTKSASDRLALRRGAVVVRPGDVYGPGSVPWTIRPLELARAGLLTLPGRGDGLMLPVYVDDLVEALLAAAQRGKPGRAYTAWDGEAVSFAEYFGRLAQIAGARKPRRLPKPLLEAMGAAAELGARLRGRPPAFTGRSATFIDRRGTVSTARIGDELGWEPSVDLAEGVRRSAEWARGAGLIDRR